MVKRLAAAVGLIALGVWCLTGGPRPVKAQFNGCPPGLCNFVQQSNYTGWGDIATAVNYWGMRAYSAATRGKRVMQICDAATLTTCTDIGTNTGTGLVSISAISALSQCATSCAIRTLYDQVGSVNLVQTTAGFAPPWVSNGGPSASFSAAHFTTANGEALPATYGTLSQPYSFMCTTIHNDTSTVVENILGNNSGTMGLGYGGGGLAASPFIYGGSTSANGSATDNAWHFIGGTGSGGSGQFYVDGAASGSSAAIGSSSFSGAIALGQGNANKVNMNFEECAAFSSSLSTGNISSLSSNSHSLFGF